MTDDGAVPLSLEEIREARAMLQAWRSGKAVVIAICWIGGALGFAAVSLNNGWGFLHQWFGVK